MRDQPKADEIWKHQNHGLDSLSLFVYQILGVSGPEITDTMFRAGGIARLYETSGIVHVFIDLRGVAVKQSTKYCKNLMLYIEISTAALFGYAPWMISWAIATGSHALSE